MFVDMGRHPYELHEIPFEKIVAVAKNRGLLPEKGSVTGDGYDEKILEETREWIYAWEEKGIQITTPFESTYPKLLRRLETMPEVLYVRGDYTALDEQAIAVIGSRTCSDYGIAACKTLVRDLVYQGICIVSGMAYGVDSMAHKVAIEEGGRTVAVFGCGIDICYPKVHQKLMDAIENHGALISEFPPGTPPLPHHFRKRNRIISGLSQGVLVVEARKKSGTMITTSYAAEQGVDVFAIPGNIDQPKSEGTNELIQMGAKLVTCAEDVLVELPHLRSIRQMRMETVVTNLTEEERIVYDTVHGAAKGIAEILSETNLTAAVIMAKLGLLEIKGLVERIGVDRFRSCR